MSGLGPHCCLVSRYHSPLSIDKETEALIQELSLPDSKTHALSSPPGSPDLPTVLSSFTVFYNLLLCLLTIVPNPGPEGWVFPGGPREQQRAREQTASERGLPTSGRLLGNQEQQRSGAKRKEQGGVFQPQPRPFVHCG